MVIVLLGLVIGITVTQAAWFRATNGNYAFNIERACADGFTIAAAYVFTFQGDQYPPGDTVQSLYIRRYAIDINEIVSAPVVDFFESLQDEGELDDGPPPPIIGTGSVTLQLQSTPVNVSNDPNFAIESLYWGRADIPWTLDFSVYPNLSVFTAGSPSGLGWYAGNVTAGQIENCILFPPPPTEPPQDHEPAPPSHRPHRPAPVEEPPTEDPHAAPPEEPPAEDTHAAPVEAQPPAADLHSVLVEPAANH
jgi:hypothetical protein